MWCRYGFFYILLVASAFAKVAVTRLDATLHAVTRKPAAWCRRRAAAAAAASAAKPHSLCCSSAPPRALSFGLRASCLGKRQHPPAVGLSPALAAATYGCRCASPPPCRRHVRPPAGGLAVGRGAAHARHLPAGAHHLPVRCLTQAGLSFCWLSVCRLAAGLPAAEVVEACRAPGASLQHAAPPRPTHSSLHLIPCVPTCPLAGPGS